MSADATFIRNYCVIRNNTITGRDGIVYTQTGAAVDDFLLSAYADLQMNYPKFYKMDRLSKFGVLAAEVVTKGLSLKTDYDPASVSLVLTNAHASLDTDVRYFESTRRIPSPALFVYTLSNIVAGEICIRHGIKGENAFFISEKFDPVLMKEYVDMVLSQSLSEICIAGWVDVMDAHHDVFLYLAQKERGENSLEHTVSNLSELYEA